MEDLWKYVVYAGYYCNVTAWRVSLRGHFSLGGECVGPFPIGAYPVQVLLKYSMHIYAFTRLYANIDGN